MIDTIITSVVAFAATNVDDIVVLTVLYGSGRYGGGDIAGGQLLGIAVLTGASLALSAIGGIIDPRYVGLLGLFPVYLGVRQLLALLRSRPVEEVTGVAGTSARGLIAVAMITIANGGDNIGVYVPLLAGMTATEKIILAITFFILVFVWCYAARHLARHPLLVPAFRRYAHALVPVVLIALGVYILAESRAFSLFGSS